MRFAPRTATRPRRLRPSFARRLRPSFLGGHGVLVVLTALVGCSPLLLGHQAPRPLAAPPLGPSAALSEPSTPPQAAPEDSAGLAPPGQGPAAAPAIVRFDPVAALPPRVRVDGVGEGLLGAALAVDGVAFATEVLLGQLEVRPPDGPPSTVTVAAVDPAGFRVLTPQVTADAVALWERVAAGDAALTHETGQQRGLSPGAQVSAGLTGAPLRVGAWATNGTPPVADAVISPQTAAAVGLQGVRTLLVALRPEADPHAVAGRLTDRLGAPATVIADPRTPHPVRVRGRLTAANVWDYLALCESGGDWHINTGNGYYGGLQFLPESWYLVGGTGLPHEHSREEQIYRARLLLAIQGWRAWPVCSVLLGLRPPDPPAPPQAAAPAPAPPAQAPPPPPGTAAGASPEPSPAPSPEPRPTASPRPSPSDSPAPGPAPSPTLPLPPGPSPSP